MLSAFAARKAAHAANSLPQAEATVLPAVTTAAETPPSPSKPNSKRKSTSHPPNSSRKRKKKRQTESKSTRYFEPDSDVLNHSADVIFIDSDQDEDEGISDPLVLNTGSGATVIGKRAWSPSAPVNDSSEDELDYITDVPVPYASFVPAARPALQTWTTFRVFPDQNMFDLHAEEVEALGLSTEAATLILLSPGETLSLLGTYMFAVLQGSISICGMPISASSKFHRVFAPRSAPIPILEAFDETVRMSTPTIPTRLQSVIQNNAIVVVLCQLRTGIEGLGRICRIFDGVFEPSHMGGERKTDRNLRVTGAQMLIEPEKDIQPFVFPETWKTAIKSLLVSDSPVGIYLVKGEKNSGKSTFARIVLNNLLCRYRKVAFLDCDLGQSEFTPGGLVALNIIEDPIFGPSFTHPTIPNFAHYLGVVTPRQSPSQYLDSIQSLLETYRLDVQVPVDADSDEDSRISHTIPLVVNMMGWTKGLGADLARRIEEMVQPTDIFEMGSLPSELSFDPVHAPKVHCLQPIARSVLTANYTASDHRSMAMLSYFHAVFPRIAPKSLQQITAATWNTATPLCAHPPYEVDWSRAFDKIYLCGAGAEDVVCSEIERVLNGALVGLVACESGSYDDSFGESASGISYVQGSEVPTLSQSSCYGLALIRAMSPSSSHMHIITPLPPDQLSRCRLLVKGEMELSLWGMLDFRSSNGGEIAGVERSRIPYLQWDKGEGLGADKRRVRRNLLRRGQM